MVGVGVVVFVLIVDLECVVVELCGCVGDVVVVFDVVFGGVY